MHEYYIRYNGQSVGPMPKHELKNYGLRPDSMVWTQNMPSWAPAYTVPDLRDVLGEARTTPPPFNQSQTGFYSTFDGLENTGTSGKSRLVFGLFAILLGWIGLQYFYVGKTTAGIISIVLSLCSCGLWEIVTLIQGILVLVMDQQTFENKYVYSTTTFPVF